ncbi:MAG: shikimate kinase [Balneolaceae bacterium]|nr:MAG: shikimate kinase [Balneolaceae bacterium]
MISEKKIKPPIVLCGMMGTGKSTLGRLLAEELSLPFYDLDKMIEQKTGKSIPQIFEEFGEKEFRRIEREVLTAFVQSCDGVLALGGGSLQNQHLTDHVKLYAWLVFINTPIELILERVLRKKNRPMIKTEDPEKTREKIEQLFEARKPLYKQAHITVQTDGRDAEVFATEIVKRLKIYAA